jgi:acyl carrier protein
MSLTKQGLHPEVDDASAIITILTDLFRDVFADPTIVLYPETTAEDIPDWDSMSQVTLTVEIEHRFNIKIKSAEMEQLRVVGELVDLIKCRLATIPT